MYALQLSGFEDYQLGLKSGLSTSTAGSDYTLKAKPEDEPLRYTPPAGPQQNNAETSFTTAQAAAQIARSGAQWLTTDGSGTTIVNYAYRATAGSDDHGGEIVSFTQFDQDLIDATEEILGMIEAIADIDFVRVDDGGGYSDNAAILFGGYNNMSPDSNIAFGVQPMTGDESASSTEGDVWLNLSIPDFNDMTPGGFGYLFLMMEVQHALGLSHPGNYDDTTLINYTDFAGYTEDTWQYSIMSLLDATNTGGDHGFEAASTPLWHDIAALQYLYGDPGNTRTGNNRYGFQSNTGIDGFRIFGSEDQIVMAIDDDGGLDTVDFTVYDEDAVIDLRPGNFSSVGGLLNNVLITEGSFIEVARGGSGDDDITGNNENNFLHGNGGSDLIIGNGGQDTVFFRYRYQDYNITRIAGGFEVEYVGPEADSDGTDRVYSVRVARFSNFRLDLVRGIAGNIKPVVTEISFDQTINPQVTVDVADLFDVVDDNGDTVLLYRFNYTDTPDGAAYVDGVMLESDRWHTLTAKELQTLTFVSNYTGEDQVGLYADKTQLKLRAYDGGVGYSNIGRIWLNIRDGYVNSAPVVERSQEFVTVGYGDSEALNNYITATDIDGDPVTIYEVRDNDAGNSYLDLNGTELASGVWHTLTAGEFFNLLVVGGTNSQDVIEVRASDGADQSNTVSITFEGPVDDYAGNSTTTGVLTDGVAVTGEIEYAGDRDWFAVSMVAGNTYTFSLQGAESMVGTIADPILRLYDSNGTFVTFNDDIAFPVQLESELVYEATTTGTFYIDAGEFEDDELGTYTLTMTVAPTSMASESQAEQGSSVASAEIGSWADTIDTAILTGRRELLRSKDGLVAERFNEYRAAMIA